MNEDILYRTSTILCRLAIHPDIAVARAGLWGLFPALAEHLADAFDPSLSALYDRVFAEVICFCRRRPAGKDIDKALNRFGLRSTKDLLGRKKALSDRPPLNDDHPAPYRKCIVLSRVTLGADVAVTSVVIAKLLERFPLAEVVLIGDKKISDIFCDIPRFRVRHCAYNLKGGLIEKVNSWIDALAIVDEEMQGLSESDGLVIDPDSRLTQLGLLPLVKADIQIGYDSSNQHIAAACKVPTIDIFADESTPMFLKRWAPHGAGPVKIVAAFGGNAPGSEKAADLPVLDSSLDINALDSRQKLRVQTALQQTLGYFHEFLAETRDRQ